MKILAVDTALGACSVAIVNGDTMLAHRWQVMIRGHAEALTPMVQEALNEADIELAEFDRLAVTTGPGTFTGQRVGLAFMRGLRLALSRPLIGVTTLEAMAAAAARQFGEPTIAVLHEAKRGEVYAAVFDEMMPTIALKLEKFEEVMGEIESFVRERDIPALTLAGTGADAAAQWLKVRNLKAAVSAVRQPDAAFVAKLALSRDEARNTAKPLYLRAPDAKLSASAIRIRPASQVDSGLFARLNAANLPEAWDSGFFAQVLGSAGGFGFVAEAHGVATGFVLVRVAADDAEILAIAVSAPHRRNGIGRRLLREAAAKALARGATRIFLEVAAGNEPARKLYESQGFRQAGRRKAYYADGQDALLLKAPLPLDPADLGKSTQLD